MWVCDGLALYRLGCWKWPGCKIGDLEVLPEMESQNKVTSSVSQGTDARSRLDSLLESLSGGLLADRIADAARMAAAKHMLLNAQAMWSEVEAENSTR